MSKSKNAFWFLVFDVPIAAKTELNFSMCKSVNFDTNKKKKNLLKNDDWRLKSVKSRIKNCILIQN